MQSLADRAPPLSAPLRGRREALAAALTYARLALFALVCAGYVLIRYVVLGRRTRP